MTPSEEQLEQIREMGSLFLSPREIACLLGFEGKELTEFMDAIIYDTGHPAYKAWKLGCTQSKYEIRKKVITLAKMGSPQAEMLAEKYIEELEIDKNV